MFYNLYHLEDLAIDDIISNIEPVSKIYYIKIYYRFNIFLKRSTSFV